MPAFAYLLVCTLLLSQHSIPSSPPYSLLVLVILAPVYYPNSIFSMLALAHPVHDTPTSSTVSKSASRPKPVVVVRRTPSTTNSVSASKSASILASSSSLAAYSSSVSSTASASSLSSASASRSSSLLPQSRTVPSSSSAKHDAILPHASSSSSSRSAPQRQQQGHSQHVAEQRTPPTSSTHAPQPVRPRSTTPIDIHSYPPTDLLRLLASLLNQIAQANDALSPHATQSPSAAPQTIPPAYSPTQEECPIWHTLTTAARQALSTSTSPLSFHARNIPSISLEAYLLRILRYCPTTNEVFLSLLVYFDRMSKLAQEATGHRFAIDSYNVHRLVIAGVTVASKFFSDVFYTNSRYAKVSRLFSWSCFFLPFSFFNLRTSAYATEHSWLWVAFCVFIMR